MVSILILCIFKSQVGIEKNKVAEKLFADGLVDSQELALALLNLDPEEPFPIMFLKKPKGESVWFIIRLL